MQRVPMTERILQAADRLFYGKGIRAVGVDAIAAEAGISKRSLYDTFASKDALVEAYLLRRLEPLEQSDRPPAEQVLGLFERLRSRFASGAFRGCPFVNAVAELGDDCQAARRIATRFKQDRRRHLADLLIAAGAEHPQRLATQIALLAEGAIATMLVHGDPSVAADAADAARALMLADGVALVSRFGSSSHLDQPPYELPNR